MLQKFQPTMLQQKFQPTFLQQKAQRRISFPILSVFLFFNVKERFTKDDLLNGIIEILLYPMLPNPIFCCALSLQKNQKSHQRGTRKYLNNFLWLSAIMFAIIFQNLVTINVYVSVLEHSRANDKKRTIDRVLFLLREEACFFWMKISNNFSMYKIFGCIIFHLLE